MDIDTIRSLITVLSLAVFLGIVFWAWSAKRKAAFDQAAQLPFAEEDVPARQPETGARP
jgi:cytochrome c oxidase cbb3-type subunit 4